MSLPARRNVPLLICSLRATQVSMNANIGAARGEFGPLDSVILHEPDNTP